MNKLLTKLDKSPDQQTGIGRTYKTSQKQQPSHLETTKPVERQTYASSLPLEGAYARDAPRRLLLQKEPKIREGL